METNLLYFENPTQFSNSTEIIEVGSDENGHYFIPKESCYFLGGGGQDGDLGKILIEENILIIDHAKIISSRLVIYLAEQNFPLASGMKIIIQIDLDIRIVNSRLHSAGHLISSVIFEEMKLDLIPVKGYHYAVGSHVEFSSQSGFKDLDINEVNRLLKQNIEDKKTLISILVKATSMDYLTSFRISGFSPKENADIRLVKIGEFLSYACGGTHVMDTGELLGLEVTSLKSKKGNLRVKYEINRPK